MRLEGKVALISGGARGMGAEEARIFAREGAKVVVASRTPSRVDEVAQQICDEGGTAIGIPCDVGHKDQIFFGVFDGHGGKKLTRRLSFAISQNLLLISKC